MRLLPDQHGQVNLETAPDGSLRADWPLLWCEVSESAKRQNEVLSGLPLPIPWWLGRAYNHHLRFTGIYVLRPFHLLVRLWHVTPIYFWHTAYRCGLFPVDQDSFFLRTAWRWPFCTKYSRDLEYRRGMLDGRERGKRDGYAQGYRQGVQDGREAFARAVKEIFREERERDEDGTP